MFTYRLPLLACLCALALLFAQAYPIVAGNTATPVPVATEQAVDYYATAKTANGVTKFLTIIYRDELLRDLNDVGNPLHPLAGIFKFGELEVKPLPSIHRLVVRAESADAVDQFEQLVKMFDMPTRQVTLNVIFLSVPVGEAIDLGQCLNGQRKDDNMLLAAVMARVNSGKAKIISAPVLSVSDGGTATLNLSVGALKLPTLFTSVSVHADDTITLHTMLPQDASPLPGGFTDIVQIHSGAGIILASGIPLPEDKNDKTTREALVMVMATVQ